LSKAKLGRPRPEKRGRHVFLPPFGYRIERGRVVVDSVNALEVRMAFYLYARDKHDLE
jgi:hypothetical protein